jgi:hypothetical protein
MPRISRTFKLRRLLNLFILLLIVLPGFAQQNLQGKVVDSSGNPVAGATVHIKNGKASVITNNDGSFTISGNSNSILAITSIGYADTGNSRRQSNQYYCNT